jgi:hypothetical protein
MKTLATKWVLKKPLYTTPKDKRHAKYVRQLKTRGFSDEETWSLDSVVADFILPRLKRFREINNGYPDSMTEKEWNAILDDMIFAFEWNQTCESEENEQLTESQQAASWKRHEKGLQLFAQYFRHLWW